MFQICYHGWTFVAGGDIMIRKFGESGNQKCLTPFQVVRFSKHSLLSCPGLYILIREPGCIQSGTFSLHSAIVKVPVDSIGTNVCSCGMLAPSS